MGEAYTDFAVSSIGACADASTGCSNECQAVIDITASLCSAGDVYDVDSGATWDPVTMSLAMDLVLGDGNDCDLSGVSNSPAAYVPATFALALIAAHILN